MTKITLDRAVVQQALHVATAAGYPVALIAALRAALAEPQEPRAAWDDPRVQKVYDLLCDDAMPPNKQEHWEGWVARRIVNALDEPVRVEPDSPARRCGGPGCDMKCCQPVAQMGAMFHTHPAVERQRSVEAAVRPACGVDPAAKAEQEQDKRTTVADLRDAMWLDPECADKGACQSLKFKCPAKPVQEPVAWRYKKEGGGWFVSDNEPQYVEQWNDIEEIQPLYAHPPQRLPLTDEEIERLWYPSAVIAEPGKRRVAFGRAVERAHGIKEGT